MVVAFEKERQRIQLSVLFKRFVEEGVYIQENIIDITWKRDRTKIDYLGGFGSKG